MKEGVQKMSKREATRDAYGRALVELGHRRSDVVVLDADLSKSTKTASFLAQFPDRFFNVGIAEADLISTACGMALTGLKPFASTFAMFAAGRAYEQIRNDAAYANIPIVVAATHAGITVGADGGSHQAIEDIALMRVIPHMQVWVPADGIEAYHMILAAAEAEGPVYVRLGRQTVPHIMPEEYTFVPGKAHVFPGGSDVTILACGVMVNEALQAAEILREKGIGCTVMNMGSIKPFDCDALLTAAQHSRLLVTAEEHLLAGGLGSLVAEQLAGLSSKPPLVMVGIDDIFGQSGEPDELMDHYGLRARNIVDKVLNRLGQSNR
jgi:transketolase